MSNVLQVQGVYKTFKTDFWKPKAQILQDVSFYVPENSLCGLVGPNGAGKTTIIKSILNFVHPEQGSIEVLGSTIDDQKVRAQIGYLPEQAYYYDYLTGFEFLDFYAKLFKMSKSEKEKRITQLLVEVGLTHAKDKKLRNYSKGMLQRIGIAQALINDPKFVILDEPMTGLDPIGRRQVRDIIFNLKQSGKTVLVSSHILSDIEYLCDHVVLVVGGKIKAFGLMKEVVVPKVHRIDYFLTTETDPSIPDHWKDKVELKTFPNKTILHVLTPDQIGLNDVYGWCHEQKIEIESMVPHKDSLEDLMVGFLKEGV